jgi:hypothetical protein
MPCRPRPSPSPIAAGPYCRHGPTRHHPTCIAMPTATPPLSAVRPQRWGKVAFTLPQAISRNNLHSAPRPALCLCSSSLYIIQCRRVIRWPQASSIAFCRIAILKEVVGRSAWRSSTVIRSHWEGERPSTSPSCHPLVLPPPPWGFLHHRAPIWPVNRCHRPRLDPPLAYASARPPPP